MHYVEDTIDSVTVSVSSNFLKTSMEKKGSFEIVKNKLREVIGQNDIELKCIIVEEKKSEDNENSNDDILENKNVDIEVNKSEDKQIKPVKKVHPLLKEDFIFDTFIPGDNSNFAYNAALAVAKDPGKKYNPILLYGGSGLGKTHLMQAIGNYIYNNGGEKLKICYVSAETFTNEFTSSLHYKNPNDFKNKYRNLDVLLLDDIHFLSEKEATQEALFYTFEALFNKNAQMVFTCDRPIKEIKSMADRLVSRLSKGLCIDITIPNFETRCAILQKKIEQEGKILSQDIIEYIAKNVETNVRELEAALNKVFGYAELIGQNPTLEIVQKLLKDLFTSNAQQNISLETIQTVIAKNYQITVAELKGKKRDKKFVIPRQIAIYISRELTEISYTELGREFGGKDHTTISYAYEKIAEQIKIDSSFESKIQLLIKEIREYKC
jgi:chromosomal replication initiator protein